MKRRAFLKFLGLAPVAAAVPAMALTRAEKPTEVRRAGFYMDVEAGEHKARIGATFKIHIHGHDLSTAEETSRQKQARLGNSDTNKLHPMRNDDGTAGLISDFY